MTNPLPVPESTLHRLHLAHLMIDRVLLSDRCELADTPEVRILCKDIHDLAGNVRQTIVDWAWTTTSATPIEGEHCRDCATIGVVSTVKAAGLCDWCDGFHRAYHRSPPRHLLELRKQGVRITSRHITQAINPTPKPKKGRAA